MNPLNYQLAVDDFIVLTQADGPVMYSLDLFTTTSLFWVLHCPAWHITRAASHGLHNDPSFGSKEYIPQIYFNYINMQCPGILTIQNHNFLNPLNRYTTQENLTALYCNFQMIRNLVVQWIQTAQYQMLQLGLGTGQD